MLTDIYMKFREDSSTKGHLGSGKGRGRGYIFITTFMRRIKFCILTGNEKENSSQIFQTCTLTVFI